MKYAASSSKSHTAMEEKYFMYASIRIHRYEYATTSGSSPKNPAAKTLEKSNFTNPEV
jgi:hypothetical protein